MNNQEKPNKEKQTSNSSSYSDKKDTKLELSDKELALLDISLSILPFL